MAATSPPYQTDSCRLASRAAEQVELARRGHECRENDEEARRQYDEGPETLWEWRSLEPQVSQSLGREDAPCHEAVEQKVELVLGAGLAEEQRREQPGTKIENSQAWPRLRRSRRPRKSQTARRAGPQKAEEAERDPGARRGSSGPGNPGTFLRPASIETTAGMPSIATNASSSSPLEWPRYWSRYTAPETATARAADAQTAALRGDPQSTSTPRTGRAPSASMGRIVILASERRPSAARAAARLRSGRAVSGGEPLAEHVMRGMNITRPNRKLGLRNR